MARIWVGDSRGVGLQYIYESSSNVADKFIVKGGEAYNWFHNTAILEIEAELQKSKSHKIIIMMGVNDCANICVSQYVDTSTYYADKYVEDVNRLVQTYSTTKFFFVSANPVDGNYPSVYAKNGSYIPKADLNNQIDIFNARIKRDCKAIYVDCCSYLRNIGFSTTDGIHYTTATSKKIYEFVVNATLGQTTTYNFVPRLEAPSRSDPWWISSSKGGKNDCIIVYGCALADGKSCLPNCVGYAWGRFSEILGEKCKLSTSNAEDWWGHTSDGYERGQSPRLGAVICWSKGQVGYQYDDGAGHVAIVEKINDDGTIVTSESGWQSSTLFWTTTRSDDGNWGASSAYKFQGFIYNPKVTGALVQGTLQTVKDNLYYFLETAQNMINKEDHWDTIQDGTEYPFTKQQASTAFVMYCAHAIEGLIGEVFPDVHSASEVARQGVDQIMGDWLSGPANDCNISKPYPGDIVSIRTTSKKREDEYDCERIGIIVNILEEGTKFEAVMCTSSDGVHLVEYELDSNQIAGYYRPNWIAVGASVLHLVGYAFGLSVYQEISSKQDATLREVCYLNNQLEPSIASSHVRLSVINYTSGISAIFLASGVAGQSPGGPNLKFDDLILEGFSAVQCSIIEQLMSYGLNAAQAVGVLANIKNESGFRPDAVGDNGTSFGLCQWHLGRGDAMKAFCGGGDKWKTDVTGQIGYLWKELQGTHSHAYDKFKDCPNTLQGCRDTAAQFCIHFEVPADRYIRAEERADQAETYWNQIVTQL